MNLPRSLVIGSLLTIVVLGAIIAGLLLVGSPAEERARRLDDRRVQDLTGIARAVDLYWTRRSRLPSSLEELRQEPGGGVRLEDPSTNQRYEYRPLEADRYEVCAQFDRESQQTDVPRADGFWSHTAGRQCFARAARKIG